MKTQYFKLGALATKQLSKLDDKVYTYRIVGEKLGVVYCHYEQGWEHINLQHANEEFLYVLGGHLHATLGDEQYELKAGDAILIPTNQVHTFIALEKTEALVMFAPPITETEARAMMQKMKQ